MNDIVLIAVIKSVYNSNGFVTITSFSDVPERFFDLEKVNLEIFGTYKQIIVDNVEIIGKEILLKFRNFDSDEDATALIGKRIFIDESKSIDLPDDCYFIHDLVGSKVIKDQQFFGELIEVISLSSNDVYVIKDFEEKEFLIPAIRDFVERFDEVEKILYLTPGCDLEYAED